MDGADDGGREGGVMFDTTKRETHHMNQGFKQLTRRLKSTFNLKTQNNKEDITAARLADADIVVFGGPRDKFSTAEFDAIKSYIEQGGSVLLMLGEGGEAKLGTNVNYLTEEFGIMVNSDCVVRTVYYKYLHPKEVFVSNGIVNREITRIAQGAKGSGVNEAEGAAGRPASTGLNFVYPHGATLNVQKPAIPILSSGYIAYPLNRPVGAVYTQKGGKGRLAVVGSSLMFDDQWLMKEDNMKIMEVLFRWLHPAESLQLDTIDAEDPELNDYHYVPDTEALAERLRCCLQESEELPRDFTTLFDDTLFKFDTTVIPDAVRLHEQLNVKHEPLSLIPPQFETPLPPLEPGVFPPTMREPPPPALDQFDLDECFASERVRLAHLANKCKQSSDEDLEYFVRESGEILGVSNKLKSGQKGSKDILEHIFRQLVNFKKFTPEQ